MRDDIILGVGTSFLFGFEGSDYVVTARHNLSGRHAETNVTIHPTGGGPNQIELLTVVPVAASTPTTPELSVTSQGRRIRFDDLDSGDLKDICAYGHPDGRIVDVACIGPFQFSDELVTRAVNHETYGLIPLPLSAGDDAFVLGYPHFVDGGASFLPIWKRASIASDPQRADDRERPPRLLLDTATRRGMSGAPVFVRQSGLIIPGPPFQRDQLLGDEIIGTAHDFLGCYSSRLGEKDQLDSQLGIVWTRRAIEEILQARQILDLSS